MYLSLFMSEIYLLVGDTLSAISQQGEKIVSLYKKTSRLQQFFLI